jgi:2-polyprenyl-3-methyl-5-hydroxy-6-metoxy-1,4-benzoquinol methylase
MDTMSFSRMGAKCTGVDLSDDAIKLAREINDELKLDAKFVCCNVYGTSEYVKEQFDIVFTSYGTIGWLPDLDPWAKMIVERLKPGGFFISPSFIQSFGCSTMSLHILNIITIIVNLLLQKMKELIQIVMLISKARNIAGTIALAKC